jgi:hypothetical protein
LSTPATKWTPIALLLVDQLVENLDGQDTPANAGVSWRLQIIFTAANTEIHINVG